jgi:hypothetical protein
MEILNVLYIVCKKNNRYKKGGGIPSFFYVLKKLSRLVFVRKQDGKETG